MPTGSFVRIPYYWMNTTPWYVRFWDANPLSGFHSHEVDPWIWARTIQLSEPAETNPITRHPRLAISIGKNWFSRDVEALSQHQDSISIFSPVDVFTTTTTCIIYWQMSWIQFNNHGSVLIYNRIRRSAGCWNEFANGFLMQRFSSHFVLFEPNS